jgi:1-acyl-sn-glycerol-3-phosphate acyltransferase
MTAARADLATLSVAAAAPGHRLAAPLFDGFCRFFLRGLGSLSVSREAPLPARPYMVCANHRSHVDSLVLMQAADLRFGQCGLLAAEDYYFRQAARLRLVSSVLRLVPVERRPTADGFAATLVACRRFLDTGGRMLVAYPEGTRSTDGRMAGFKRGPVTLALRFGLPVVPAFVSGTERVLRKGAALPRPAAVRVRFGAPLEAAAGLEGAALRDEARRLTEALERRVRELAA